MGRNVDTLIEDIKELKIKGADVYAVRVSKALIDDAAEYIESGEEGGLKLQVQRWGADVIKARRNQVTLRNTVRNILYRIEKIDSDNDRKVLEVLKSNAEAFISTVNNAQEKISYLGANTIQNGYKVLTNSYSKTVKGILKVACKDMGKDVTVYVAETRPKYQGIRMARELAEMGIRTVLVVDSAIRHLIREIDMVLVGADTVSSDGSIISKIGTSQIGLVAHEARVPFFVAAPTFKFSEDTLSGVMVTIEEGDTQDILKDSGLDSLFADGKIAVRNPTFDATPPQYIHGIITELYVMSPFSIGEFLARRSGVIS